MIVETIEALSGFLMVFQVFSESKGNECDMADRGSAFNQPFHVGVQGVCLTFEIRRELDFTRTLGCVSIFFG